MFLKTNDGIFKQNLTLNVSYVIVNIGQVTVQRGTISTLW